MWLKVWISALTVWTTLQDNAIICFIEKEGFNDLFQAMMIAEFFEIGVQYFH